MSERDYGPEECEKVLKHLYDTLTACIDFFVNAHLERKDLPKEIFEDSLLTLHTDIEEHWGVSRAMAEEEEQQEKDAGERIEGLVTLAAAGADVQEIVEADAALDAAEVQALQDEMAEEQYVLPSGWPLSHV